LVKAHAEGERLDQLATRFRVDLTTVEKHLRPAGLQKRCLWVGARQTCIKLCRQGRSVKFVADQLGVGATTVTQALSKAGIPPRRRDRPSAWG
jgi:transposase